MDSLTELFCRIDDFCMAFEPVWPQRLLADGQIHRRRHASLELSALMTLAVLFHQLRFRHFKRFYWAYACRLLRQQFPDLLSYQRSIELLPRGAVPLAALFDSLKGQCAGISMVDSTPIAVGDNRRIARHKVFAGLAARGKRSTGWFFGFKLHVVINHQGELWALQFPPGNIDDRQPVPRLCQGLFGKLVGDQGYLAKWLSTLLAPQDLDLITKVPKCG
jgi:Transposase DDE domain